MKLAEALQIRADLMQRIGQLENRLSNNAKVQEGDTPSEKPAELLAELDRLLDELEALVTRINLTNCETVSGGKTLTALISRRDALTRRLSILRGFLDNASQRVQRHMSSEIRQLSTVNVSEMQTDLDRRSKELRELNSCIQELNWTTEIKD